MPARSVDVRELLPLPTIRELVTALNGSEEDVTFFEERERRRGSTEYQQHRAFRARCATLRILLASDLDWTGHESELEQLLDILAEYAGDAEPVEGLWNDQVSHACVLGFASWSALAEGFEFWSAVHTLTAQLPSAQELSDEDVERLAGGVG